MTYLLFISIVYHLEFLEKGEEVLREDIVQKLREDLRKELWEEEREHVRQKLQQIINNAENLIRLVECQTYVENGTRLIYLLS